MTRAIMIFLGLVCLGFSVQNFWQFVENERALDLYVGTFTGAVAVFVLGVNLGRRDP